LARGSGRENSGCCGGTDKNTDEEEKVSWMGYRRPGASEVQRESREGRFCGLTVMMGERRMK
jgi:hypothetical protein